MGWDSRGVPGTAIPHLSPKEDWHDSSIEEYFDPRHFQQRFLKGQHGTSGVFTPIEALWIEVPAGNRLMLRNVRLLHHGRRSWPWLLAIALGATGLSLVFLWRRRGKHVART